MNSIYEVEYDSKWIDDEVKGYIKKGGLVKGEKAYFIFLDYGSRPLSFYPIRLCKVHYIQPEEPYRVIFEVGNFLTFKDSKDEEAFNEGITRWLTDKNLIDKSDEETIVKKLVLFCNDKLMANNLQEAEGKEEQIWERIIDYLIEVKPIDSRAQFDRSLFFRFEIKDEKTFRTLNVKDGKFKLKPGKDYSFRFHAYQPHFMKFNEGDIARIIFGIEEKVLRHVGERALRMPLNQRTYTKDFKISVNNLVFGTKSSVVFEREEDEYNAPSHEVSFIVPMWRIGILRKFLSFPIGLLFLGLPDDIAKLLTSLGLPLPSIAVTFLGIFLCSVSLYQLESK